jgi:Tol biopolymer transport system component
MVDLNDHDRWIHLGETRAWSWHQTCMLQWLPGSSTEIIYNDCEGDRFVSRILNIKTGRSRTLPMPIYCVSPDARWAIVNDFRRSGDMRPETGYAGLADPARDSLAPDNSGIWRMDLQSGRHELILSLADVIAIPSTKPYSKGAKHYFDHLLFSPDGQRFAFFQRWRGEAEGRGFATRMLTADRNGRDVRVLDPYGKTSHYLWRDARTILVWMNHPFHGDKFYLIDEPTGTVEVFAPDKMPVNGHASYLPGKRYVVCDTYPDKKRLQHTYLYDTKTAARHELGAFYAPPEYSGYWRCDTTPRFSPDGRKIVIDSPHGGDGRQMYLIDIYGIVG